MSHHSLQSQRRQSIFFLISSWSLLHTLCPPPPLHVSFMITRVGNPVASPVCGLFLAGILHPFACAYECIMSAVEKMMEKEMLNCQYIPVYTYMYFKIEKMKHHGNFIPSIQILNQPPFGDYSATWNFLTASFPDFYFEVLHIFWYCHDAAWRFMYACQTENGSKRDFVYKVYANWVFSSYS